MKSERDVSPHEPWVEITPGHWRLKDKELSVPPHIGYEPFPEPPEDAEYWDVRYCTLHCVQNTMPPNYGEPGRYNLCRIKVYFATHSYDPSASNSFKRPASPFETSYFSINPGMSKAKGVE